MKLNVCLKYISVHFSVRDTFLDTSLEDESIKVQTYNVTKNGEKIDNKKCKVKVYKNKGDDIEF